MWFRKKKPILNYNVKFRDGSCKIIKADSFSEYIFHTEFYVDGNVVASLYGTRNIVSMGETKEEDEKLSRHS